MMPASESLLAFTITMNRITTLRLDWTSGPAVNRRSSTGRVGFCTTDNGHGIISEVIARGVGYEMVQALARSIIRPRCQYVQASSPDMTTQIAFRRHAGGFYWRLLQNFIRQISYCGNLAKTPCW